MVHAPHWAIPHPNFVPVSPSTSRNTHNTGISAGASIATVRPLIASSNVSVIVACLRRRASTPVSRLALAALRRDAGCLRVEESLRGFLLCWSRLCGQGGNQRPELCNVLLEEFARSLIRKSSIGVNEIRPEGNIGFATHDQATEDSEDLAQILLTDRRADGTRRRSGDGNRLAPPDVPIIWLGAPINRVLHHRGNRAMVLRSDKQRRVDRGDLIGKANDGGGSRIFEILTIHW